MKLLKGKYLNMFVMNSFSKLCVNVDSFLCSNCRVVIYIYLGI